MPQENVDKLDRIFEHLFEGRRIGPELLAEDAEWVNPRQPPALINSGVQVPSCLASASIIATACSLTVNIW